jgi:hypothetical protein
VRIGDNIAVVVEDDAGAEASGGGYLDHLRIDLSNYRHEALLEAGRGTRVRRRRR